MASGGDFKGINTDSIPGAQTKIQEYVLAIQNHLDSMNNMYVVHAFKGIYASAVKDFIGAVAVSAKKVLTKIETFDEEIEAASKRYAAKDIEVAGSMNNSDVSQNVQTPEAIVRGTPTPAPGPTPTP